MHDESIFQEANFSSTVLTGMEDNRETVIAVARGVAIAIPKAGVEKE